MEQTFYILSCLADLIIILLSLLPTRGKYFYSAHRHCVNTRFESAYTCVIAILLPQGIYFRYVFWDYPGSMERFMTNLTLDVFLVLAFFFYLFLIKPSNRYRLTGFSEECQEKGIQQLRAVVETQLTAAGYKKDNYNLSNNGQQISFQGVSDLIIKQCLAEIDNYLESEKLVHYKKAYYLVTLLWSGFFVYDLFKVISTFIR